MKSSQRIIYQKLGKLVWPDKLGAVSLRPTSLSISGLYHYISFLRETGQDVSRFELTFWRKIFQPVSVGVMMLLALSFILARYAV